MSFSTDLADDTKLEAAAAELWATVAMLFTNETVLASSTICDPNEAALEALRNCSSAVDCVALADLMALAKVPRQLVRRMQLVVIWQLLNLCLVRIRR